MARSLRSTSFYTPKIARDSVRWLSYEYYHVKDSEVFHPTLQTDVWAFGMTILVRSRLPSTYGILIKISTQEILTLDVPYGYIQSDGRVTKAILEGQKPVKSTPKNGGSDAELRNDLWSLCCKCWSQKQKERPSMQQVLRELIKIKYRHGVGFGDRQVKA